MASPRRLVRDLATTVIISRVIPLVLVATGSIGLLAAAALMVERLHLLEDPTYVPICSVNAVFSCGPVMTTPQASAFGVPNPLIGLIGFAVVVTTGMALLAGAQFQQWYWIGLQLGVTFAIAFVHWLMYQSIFRIQALCIYCMVVWVATAVLFWYVTLYNLATTSGGLPGWSQNGGVVLLRNHTAILSLWLLSVTLVLLQAFWL